MTLPKSVLLREDGPREGFQMLPHVVPTEAKLRLIEALSETGMTSIEVASFVRPDRVPQMADAEQLVAGLKPKADIRYRALYLNEKGFLRAVSFPVLKLEGYIHLAVSEKFLLANNGITLEQSLARIPKWIELFCTHRLGIDRIMLSTAFGYADEGEFAPSRTLSIVSRALDAISAAGSSVGEVTFADTTGFAHPESVRRMVGEFRSRWPTIPVGLHLHDTRGCGMANVYAGLLEGVERFDCSVGGMGGCPFSPGAAGNVPTEDVAFLCETAGVKTGLNLALYVECAKLAESIAGCPLPGKLKQGGLV